jgi:glycosyltransferase involved in cell wall biosynthesis
LGVEIFEPDRSDPPSSPKTVLFLSRIHPKKGLDVLIPALGDLARKRDDFALVLAGSGEVQYEREIARLLVQHDIVGRTAWAGFVHGTDKSALFARSNIFVLPSYQENFGLAVAEAMAAGIPVVISDRVNIHQEVARYRAGLVTALNRGEVAAALERLLDDEALQREMGNNGQRLVREKFSWSRIGAQIAELYKNTLRRTHPADHEAEQRGVVCCFEGALFHTVPGRMSFTRWRKKLL